jgi:excisionase family DNA binding protein
MGDTGGAGSGPGGGDGNTGPGRVALYSVAELATLWRCSKQYIYTLISREGLKTVQLGSGRAKTRIRQSDAESFLARHTSGRTA